MVLPTRGLTTRGSYNQRSYNQGFLQPGVLQPGVLTTRGLTTRGSYNQGSCNHRSYLCKTWESINEVMGRKSDKAIIIEPEFEDKKLTDLTEIA